LQVDTGTISASTPDEPSQHLLQRLTLPDRFEGLQEKLGLDYRRILVPSDKRIKDKLFLIAESIRSRREGTLIPLAGGTGVGKTTFAFSLDVLGPKYFTATERFEGMITLAGLNQKVRDALAKRPGDGEIIVPIVIDRESEPPSETELAELRRFFRAPHLGQRCILLWPDPQEPRAREVARAFSTVAGEPVVDLPVVVEGPPRETWAEIAASTIEAVNDVTADELGIDLASYNLNEAATIGGFLRKVSTSFNQRRVDLLGRLEKPVSVAFLFASESTDAGILSTFTRHRNFGYLEARSLLDISANSALGKWWSRKPGLLQNAILQLEARAYCIPPSVTVRALRTFGAAIPELDFLKAGWRASTTEFIKTLGNSDFGWYLANKHRSASETRGFPATAAVDAFAQIATAYGFESGRDKALNRVMGSAFDTYLKQLNAGEQAAVKIEKSLGFCNITPDVSFHYPDVVRTAEFAWWGGAGLDRANRARCAQYILKKLRDYIEQLGWQAD